jgi:phage terminase large subunit GpA-like protein
MTTPAISSAVLDVFLQASGVLKPPPKLTVSQWAERERVLSTESSAFGGRYRIDLAPYQRGMMDAVNQPGVEEIVYMTSAQVGKSICLENIFGYFVDNDPCPVIYMWPSLEGAKEWVLDTLDPFIRDTEVLAHKFADGARKSANKTLFKKFPGGHLSVIGANSPAGLRRRRARIIFGEEIDGYPASAGEEGDPLSIVQKRQITFWNALRILASTCTIKGESRIEAKYEDSNKQRFWVPCLHCEEFQVLKWKRVVYPKNEEPTEENTFYACEHCGAAIAEFEKREMLARGEWRADRPEITKVLGFWINELYSPFSTWAKMAQQFRNALEHRENPELLKAFVTLSLAETWEDKDEQLDKEALRRRVEDYPPPALPDGVIVLTASCDVQEDRIQIEVVGWGKAFESWSVDWKMIEGDTSKPEVWARLDEYLQTRFLHARGVRLEIAATFIDSGYHANEVYAFTKGKGDRRIYASKGMQNFFHAPLGKWNRNNRARVKMYPVGVSQIKKLIYAWLKIGEHGAGFMHFSREKNDADYFNQLTCEQLKKKYVKGFPVLFWEKPAGARNEALDCRVYAYAALLSLSENPAAMLDRLRKELLERARLLAEERRARTDPNQLSLLEQAADLPPDPEESPARVPEAVPPVEGFDSQQIDALIKNAREERQPDPVPAPLEPTAEEYKLAEKDDSQKNAENLTRRKIKVRRSGWL